MKYEYKIIKSIITASVLDLENMLTKLGSEGWDIAYQVAHSQFIITTLKREVAPVAKKESKNPEQKKAPEVEVPEVKDK